MPTRARPSFPVQAWEFDLGWAWICLLRALGLAQVNRGLPTIQWDCDKRALDLEASGVILRNRLLVMAQYGETGNAAAGTRKRSL